MSLLNERHHIHTLVQTELQVPSGLLAEGTVMHPNIHIDTIRYALCRVGSGLDHTIGEQAMIFHEMSLDPKKQPYAAYLLVTDRRFVGTVGWLSGDFCDIRFSEIDEVKFNKGMLTIELKLRAGQRWENLSFGSYEEELRNFLRPMVQAPKEVREPPPRPLCVPSEQDPTGALQAIQWMGVPDARNELLLRYVHMAHVGGLMPANVACDLVARLVLHHRNEHFGRGAHQGRFLSPLSSNDLSNCFVQMFGNPISHSEQPVRTLVFSSNMTSNAGTAAVSTAVGLASAVILGVGWTQRARPTVPNFGFMVADTGSLSSFRLQAPGGQVGLHRKVPGLVDDILYNLLNPEDAILLRRAVYGWSEKSDALLVKDPNEIVARLQSVVGPFDINVLNKKHGQQ